MNNDENKSGRPSKKRSPFTEIFRELVGNCTQQEIADKIGVSRQNVGKWISGITTPDIETLCKIASAYNVTTDYLLGRSDVKTVNADLQGACQYTHLTEEAANAIKEFIENNEFQVASLNRVLSSALFYDVIQGVWESEENKMRKQYIESTSEFLNVFSSPAVNYSQSIKESFYKCYASYFDFHSIDILYIDSEYLQYHEPSVHFPENYYTACLSRHFNDESNRDIEVNEYSTIKALIKLLSYCAEENFTENYGKYVEVANESITRKFEKDWLTKIVDTEQNIIKITELVKNGLCKASEEREKKEHEPTEKDGD